jgi:16S rRNA (guanine966-N2)-methyltransferase
MNAPGRIRIIGGTLRNSRLEVPEIPGLRPTSDRVRETLFNWLQPVLGGARCLDLFAGTGALGIEALSRGAAAVTFVEHAPKLAAALKANLSRLKTEGEVVTSEAQRWLAGPARPYDIVLLDPPFALEAWGSIAATLESGGWLTPGAWIYVEAPRGATFELPATWRPHRQGQAGEVAYAIYRRTPADPLS